MSSCGLEQPAPSLVHQWGGGSPYTLDRATQLGAASPSPQISGCGVSVVLLQVEAVLTLQPGGEGREGSEWRTEVAATVIGSQLPAPRPCSPPSGSCTYDTALGKGGREALRREAAGAQLLTAYPQCGHRHKGLWLCRLNSALRLYMVNPCSTVCIEHTAVNK